MKTNLFESCARLLALTVGVILMSAFSTSATQPGSAKGGATRLQGGVTARSTATAPAHSEMGACSARCGLVCPACPACQTVTHTRLEKPIKGHQAKVVPVQEHGCPACRTERVVTGHGKAKSVVWQHHCQLCDQAGGGCCSLPGAHHGHSDAMN